MIRKSLSDILREGDRKSLSSAWESATPADEFKPLPTGEYIASIERGVLFNSQTNGTPGCKLTFRVIEGEHANRRFWHDLWLTTAAMPMTKRDLKKVGLTSLDQLERPIPQGIVCKVKLTLRKDDNGAEFNRVKSFEFLRTDPVEPNPFAPSDEQLDSTEF